MDKYTLQEQAYKRGFQVGFAEGSERGKSKWIYVDNSEIICKACGTRRAKFYGTDVPFLAVSKTSVTIVEV